MRGSSRQSSSSSTRLREARRASSVPASRSAGREAVVVGRRVGDVLALSLLAAAAEHDGRRHARPAARHRLLAALQHVVVDVDARGLPAHPRAAYSEHMSRTLACAAVLVLCAAAPAAAALPRPGALVAGSLARRHPARRDARRRCGPRSAARTACAAAARGTTWYFTYRAVRPARARASSSPADACRPSTRCGSRPAGTHRRGLAARRGPGRRSRRSPGPLLPIACSGYQALVRDSATARTVYYVVDGEALGLRAAARAARTRAGDRARGRAGGGASACDGVAQPHAGPHVADARRRRRRGGARQGGVLPARRRVQVPRRVQQDRLAAGRRARTRRARLLVRQPRAGGRDRRAAARHDARRSSCPRTRRRRRSTRRAATAPRSSRTTAGRRAARRSARASPPSAALALVQPYDDPLVMAGQGTTALELLEEAPELDVLVVAGRRRRADRRLRDRREGAAARRSASSASSPRPATTRAARSPPASASASTCRARSPTASRRPSPAS